jgi:Ser/Thr protein kinase RdoA (MazF antagonist)
MDDERVLSGGNDGETTRRGDRVFRTAGPWTPGVQRLMRHLRGAGLEWVPEPLGIDDRGRETVRFIDGEVPNYPLPGYVWEERTLADAGRMLREMHDAAAGYADPEAAWRQPSHEPVETICHNDFAPYNMVFREGRLVGLIDFDMASPGSRLWDVAYLAYRLAPLSVPGNAEAGPFGTGEQLARLRTLVDAYGTPFPLTDVLRMAQARLHDLARYSDEAADRTGNPELHDHATLYRSDVAYIETITERLT